MSLFGPARNSVLILLALAALSGPAFIAYSGLTPAFGIWIRFAAMLVAAAVIAVLRLRDPLLAAAAVLGPLPGVSLFFGGTIDAPLDTAGALLAALVYVTGFSVALIAGDRFAAHVADDESPHVAAILVLQHSARLFAPIAGVAALTPAVIIAAGPPGSASPALLLSIGNALAAASSWLAVPLAGSLLAGSEDFIVRTNRIRESWWLRLGPVTRAAQPPWALSMSGIFAVLVTLAAFGSAGLAIAGDVEASFPSLAAGTLVVIAAGAFLAAAEWRRAIAASLSTCCALLFAAWGYVRSGAPLDAPHLVLSAGLCAIAFLPIAATAAAAALSGRQDAVSASEAGTLVAGPVAATAATAGLVLLAPWYRQIGDARAGFVLAIILAAGGALVFQPAITGAFEDLVPRRQTLAERYRVK
ncbi:MAG TPA: hypothetical protein VMU22_11370 [Rhizomicrobium sp.]|nr:hypothetical protein [Rhizomicrobium sp.]